MTERERLHYRVDGPREAPALVLGPAMGTTLDLWDPVIPRLARALRVIRFDHGVRTATRPPSPSIADLGADVAALLDHLGVRRASYCGISLGGMIGMWLAASAPERVDRLVLVCTSAFLPPAGLWQSRAAAVRSGGMRAVADAVLARWFGPSFRARRPGVVEALGAGLERYDPEVYASCCDAIASWDFRDRLEDIGAPTLVIAGGLDAATEPSHGYALGAGIRGARVTVLENAGHLAVVEEPEAVGDLVLRHVAAPPGGERPCAGEAVRRAVLGDAHVDRARRRASSFGAPFQEIVNRFPWGEIWTREGLSRSERSIVTLAVLAALRHDEELAMHVVAALRNGLSTDQIREVLLHAGAYAGIPVANRSLAIAERALRGAGALPESPPEDA
jgi:3-oxoadipate enol-lactonase/4-carboxymuconolactone decarboxylase